MSRNAMFAATRLQNKAYNVAHLRLLRSVSTEVRSSRGSIRGEYKPRASPTTRHLTIGTLDPSKLGGQDFLDLSNKFSCSLWFKNSPTATQLQYFRKQQFPANTKGFFYYSVPPPRFPPIMGDLRFRITPSSDPSSFHDGSDLIHAVRHAPWSFSLLHMTKANGYIHLCEQLVAEGLVSRELLERCHLIWKNSPVSAYRICRPHHFLYHLNQPMLLTFNYTYANFTLWTVGQEKFSRWILRHPFYRAFLTGSGLHRLEKLDDGFLGFRLLKIIEPPQSIAENSSHELHLIEGELVRRRGEILRIAINSDGIRELSDLV